MPEPDDDGQWPDGTRFIPCHGGMTATIHSDLQYLRHVAAHLHPPTQTRGGGRVANQHTSSGSDCEAAVVLRPRPHHRRPLPRHQLDRRHDDP